MYDQKNVIYGGDVDNQKVINATSLDKFILNQLQSNGDKYILVDGAKRIQLTGSQIRSQVIHLAKYLWKKNIKEGDVVGICSENRVEFAICIFATLSLNATVAPMNVTYTSGELEHVIKISKPKLIFTSPLAIGNVSTAVEKLNFVEQLVVFDDSVWTSKTIPYDDITAMDFSSFDINIKPTDVKKNTALILCSSGTTGMPKAVQLTQYNLFEDIYARKTILNIIPWFHGYGCVTLLLICCLGGKIIFLPRFEENIFLQLIQDYKVQIAIVVPPLMVFLGKHPIIDKYNLSSLELLICGAAPLSRETENSVKQRIGVPSVIQGYGLTETTLAVLLQTEDLNKPGSVGKPTPGTYCKVIDIKTGESLGPNKKGELCFKGNLIMKGYLNDKNSTDHAIDKDGWLHTGDIGFYDDDKEFFIVDRIKELIKYKGFQVPPAELEAILLTHPKIKDAAVIGIPDENCGELPMGFVVVQPEELLTEKEVVDYVAERTSPAKKLRGGVKFIHEIPKNPSGKILRRLLKENTINIKSKL